ncbi:MAG: right-handed parallel beta-helix repeat-containing protein, partial [Thermoplasmata archaeon]
YIIPESGAMWDPIMIAFGGTEIGGFISGSATISVSIDGFEIHGGNKAATGRYVGVLYRNVNPGTVSNMNIHHMFDSDGEGDGPRTFGILAYGNSDVTIESNEIRDFSQGGIGAQGDAGSMVDPSAIIQGNTIYGNGLETGSGWWAENGIQIEDGAGGSIIDNDVTNCRVNHPGWVSSGIMVYDAADNVKVLNNDVTLCDVGIDVTSHSHDLVDSNTVSGCTWDGIRLGPPADYVTVTNNTCYDNNYGITVYGANENLIQSNDLYENNYGILLEGDSHNNKILNNNIHHNNVNGISLATFNTNSPLGTQIHCNSIYENGGYGIHYYYILPPPSPIDATNNWWGDPSGPYHGTWWMHGSIQIGPHTEGLGDEVSDYVLYDDWKIGHHEVTVDVTPNSLNLQSKGNFMSLKITSVPDGYTMSDIKGDTVKIISSIPATLYDVTGQSFSAKFDRSDFEDWADPGEVNVLIMGQFSDGTWFYGYDTITAHS